MPKVIKWVGSLTYELRGVVELKRDEEVTLDDSIVAQLPKEGYRVIKTIKPEPEKQKEDDPDESLTDDQKDYYKKHTAKQMLEEAKLKGIDVPEICKEKKDIFTYLIDNEFFKATE